ncbi:MAG: hypothetical protein ACE5K0_05970 [Candidatus Methanofastidiosia archaeon]
MKNMFERFKKPQIVLFLLSPLLAELMTSSAPPLEFFNPFGFVFITLWYGSGALLVREISFRKGLSWLGILILGFSFGILEEGIFVKTFFDPNAVDLGEFAKFGRFFETNIPWAFYLTLFHGVHSILFPIILTYLFFPQEIKKEWISRRRISMLSIILAVLSIFGFFVFDPSKSGTPYRPTPLHFVACLLVISILCGYALKHKKKDEFSMEDIERRLGRRILVLGVVFAFLLSFGVWGIASTMKNTIFSVAFIIFVFTFFLYLQKNLIKNNLKAFSYFVVSYYVVWAFIGFLSEFSGQPEMRGMSLVGIIFLGFFLKVLKYLELKSQQIYPIKD